MLKPTLRRTGAAILTVSLAALVFLEGARGKASKQGGEPDATLAQELQEVDKQWLHAATIQDTAFLEIFFAAGMFEVQRGGVVETGEEMRKVIGTPGRHIEINIDDVIVRGIYGDTAILTDRTRQEGTAPDGRRINGEYTVMRILRKQGGRWRALGAQMTPLKPSTSAAPMTHEVPTTVPQNKTEKKLLGIDHQWANAAAKGDTEQLKKLFTNRMFEVGDDGHVSEAQELLKAIGARKSGQFEGYADQIEIRGFYADTALLTDRRVLQGKDARGRLIDAQWRATEVLVKQNGRWLLAASALTTIDQN